MKLIDYFKLEGIVYGFFMFFFVIYIGKFGISDLVLESTTSWSILFNIGLWFVLVMFCMNGFFQSAERSNQYRINKKNKKGGKK